METFEEIKQEKNLPKQLSFKRKYILVAATIAGIVVFGIIAYFVLNAEPINPSQPEIIQPSPAASGQSTVENQEEFLLLLGGEITRSSGIYQLNPTFNAQILDFQRKLFAEQLAQAPQQETIYRIDLVGGDGKVKSINSTVSYCPPRTDVCDTLADREPPTDSQSYWSPTSVIVEPGLEKIEFSIAGKVVKTIVKPSSSPKIISLDKSATEEGFKITWNVDKGSAEYVGLILEYISSPNNWEMAGFGEVGNFTLFTVDSDSIRSTLETLDFRLVATDGFRTEVYLAEDFIPTPIVKELNLFLSGVPTTERVVGQDMFLELSFIDPQTGVGCSGEGCQNGVNQGKYEVVWSSDKQNICQSDIYNGVLQYRFKKIGIHTVNVKIRHKDKEYPKGEASVQITVNPSPFPVEDNTNPKCSF